MIERSSARTAASPWQNLLTILRWTGVAIGVFLLVMECFDAMVTPRPDWFWFGAGALLIGLCLHSIRAARRTRTVSASDLQPERGVGREDLC